MPVGVQCPISSSPGEFPSYWDWLWCPGLSPVSVSITLPFAFHTCYFPFALSAIGFQSCFFFTFFIVTHSVNPSLTHFLGEFPGLGLALVPDVVVPEAGHNIGYQMLSLPERNFYIFRNAVLLVAGLNNKIVILNLDV